MRFFSYFLRTPAWVWKNRVPLWGYAKLLVAVCLAAVTALVISHDERKKEREVRCLALNVYHEARAEPELGQAMVALVTTARARENRRHWGGRTVCGVVYAKEYGVQFSWTTQKVARETPRGEAWERAQRIAREVYEGQLNAPKDLEPARYYLNPRAAARTSICWFKKTLIPVGVVGLHQFYREPTAAEKRELGKAAPAECAPRPQATSPPPKKK